MEIEIVKVEQLKYQAVDVLHIYPHNKKQVHQYRRYNRADHWCSFLGDRHGWTRVLDPVMLESAYQKYLRKTKKRGKKK